MVRQKFSQISVVICLCSLLAACSSGPETPEFCSLGKTTSPKKATSRPYQIKGIWYYPQPHYEYEEEGMASYYGGGDIFHGRPTATGERFDMNEVTAAHKTLPLPCVVKVVNLENGREIDVKVNGFFKIEEKIPIIEREPIRNVVQFTSYGKCRYEYEDYDYFD